MNTLNDITFEKKLNEIVENYVDVTKKRSKVTNIDELIKDESTIARLNRDIDNYYIGDYISGNDDWLNLIIDDLDRDFPL